MSNPINVFIDTNVFLSFHLYTKDDIEQLKILLELINTGKLKLFSTSQVVDEYNRNREVKLSQAIKEFNSKGSLPGIPRCMAAYEEAEHYREAVEKIAKAKDQLVQMVKADAAKRTLPADLLFDQIIEKSELIKVTDAIYINAIKRRNFGNPPGKTSSLGDQLSWECLLYAVQKDADLYIVSQDGDFSSDLVPSDINPFIADEWKKSNGGQLILKDQLRPFLKNIFPTIELAIDVEKTEAINGLMNSGSFSWTHHQVAKLKPMTGSISWSEADKLLEAGISNNQISWIGTDSDVRIFYRGLIDKFAGKISGERMKSLDEVFPNATLVDEEEVEF